MITLTTYALVKRIDFQGDQIIAHGLRAVEAMTL
jgi:hypothetical protein